MGAIKQKIQQSIVDSMPSDWKPAVVVAVLVFQITCFVLLIVWGWNSEH